MVRTKPTSMGRRIRPSRQLAHAVRHLRVAFEETQILMELARHQQEQLRNARLRERRCRAEAVEAMTTDGDGELTVQNGTSVQEVPNEIEMTLEAGTWDDPIMID